MNAVFERDYFAFSSSKKVLLLRSGIALGIGVLLLARLSGAYSSSSWSGVGSSVLTVAIWVGTVLLALTTPGSFATVLVNARAKHALPVLLTTPLTPLKIAIGAFASRIAVLVMFVIALWPPIALGMMFGGLRGAQLFESSAAVLGTTLILAAPAFVVSAFATRTGAAVVSAYLLGASLVTGLWLLGNQIGGKSAFGDFVAACVSPYHAIEGSLAVSQTTTLSSLSSSFDGMGTGTGAYVLLMGSVLFSCLAIAIAAWRLEREGTGGDVGGRGRIFGDGWLGRRILGAPRCKDLKYENPILDHELRIGGLGYRRSIAHTLLALLIVAEVLFFVLGGMDQASGGMRSINLHYGVLGFELGLLTLAVTAAGATAFASERESRMMELIRVTKLTPIQIVTGKLAGIARALLPCLIVPLVHVAIGAHYGVFSWFAPIALVIGGTVSLSTWAICGMAQSLDQGLPQRAVMRTMGLLGIFGVLTAAMLGVPISGIFHDTDTYIRSAVGFGANPVGASLILVSALRSGGATVEGVQGAPELPDLAFAVGGAFFWLGVYAFVGYALYRRLFIMYRTRFDA